MQRVARRALAWPVALIAVVVVAASIAVAQDDDDTEKGTIILNVDGKDVEIVTSNCFLLNTDSGYADGYELAGEGIFLTGSFDLNEDGRHDDDDKVEYDEDEENVEPKSLMNKGASITPTTENPEATITVSGLGACGIIGGGVKIKSYKVNPNSTEDHWSGDIELIVKTPSGTEKTLSGTFDSGITGVW